MTRTVVPAQPPRAGGSLPRYAPWLALPGVPFLPGSGQRRPAPYAPPMAERAWPDFPLHRDRSFREGVDLYHHGCWWEAHERWEAPWRRSSRPDPAYPLLRGMILLAASHLKHVVAQPAGAMRLLERALAQLERSLAQMPVPSVGGSGPALAGIEVAGLLAGAGAWAARASALAWPASADGRRAAVLAELPLIVLRE